MQFSKFILYLCFMGSGEYKFKRKLSALEAYEQQDEQLYELRTAFKRLRIKLQVVADYINAHPGENIKKINPSGVYNMTKRGSLGSFERRQEFILKATECLDQYTNRMEEVIEVTRRTLSRKPNKAQLVREERARAKKEKKELETTISITNKIGYSPIDRKRYE